MRHFRKPYRTSAPGTTRLTIAEREGMLAWYAEFLATGDYHWFYSVETDDLDDRRIIKSEAIAWMSDSGI
jgi:hypothetical protein